MSRYEERKLAGPRDYLDRNKIKYNKENAVIHLENTGNVADLLRQENLYYREGYDRFHGDATGAYMEIPLGEVAANDKRYKDEADRRMRVAETPTLPGDTGDMKMNSSTVESGKRVNPADFIEEAV